MYDSAIDAMAEQEGSDPKWDVHAREKMTVTLKKTKVANLPGRATRRKGRRERAWYLGGDEDSEKSQRRGRSRDGYGRSKVALVRRLRWSNERREISTAAQVNGCRWNDGGQLVVAKKKYT